MAELSPMISSAWHKESEIVHKAYAKLSSEVKKMYKCKYFATQRKDSLSNCGSDNLFGQSIQFSQFADNMNVQTIQDRN
jgi:hypothetical protein